MTPSDLSAGCVPSFNAPWSVCFSSLSCEELMRIGGNILLAGRNAFRTCRWMFFPHNFCVLDEWSFTTAQSAEALFMLDWKLIVLVVSVQILLKKNSDLLIIVIPWFFFSSRGQIMSFVVSSMPAKTTRVILPVALRCKHVGSEVVSFFSHWLGELILVNVSWSDGVKAPIGVAVLLLPRGDRA